MYQLRHIDELIEKYLANFPAIIVEGAKAVGKTSSCEQFSNTEYYLDNEIQYQILANSPEVILEDTPAVLIDEWQNLPEIWENIRRMVDHGMPVGTVLLTGSSPSIYSRLHSGSGRIVSLKMRPYTIEERGLSERFIRLSELLNDKSIKVSGKVSAKLQDYLAEIFKSGFPGIRERDEFARERFIEGYVNNIITREFQENGFDVRKPETLRSWLRSYAAAIATTTQFQTILEASQGADGNLPAWKTVTQYRDALIMLHIIEEVPSWIDYGKLFPALGKAPKHFLVDPALVTPLLGVTEEKLMKGDVPQPIGKLNKTFIGQLFESFVYQSLATYAETNQLRVSHLRLQGGRREIDFILEDNKHNKIIAIEVKSASSVTDHDVQHLNWFQETISSEFEVIKLVVYMGEYAFTRKDGVHIVPAAMLGA